MEPISPIESEHFTRAVMSATLEKARAGMVEVSKNFGHAPNARYTGYSNIDTKDAHCHEVVGGPPDYASNAIPVNKGYSDTGMPSPGDHIYDIPKIINEKINEAVAHLVSELDGMAQRCEELEIELECLKNAFPEHEDEILPKHRGKFNDY